MKWYPFVLQTKKIEECVTDLIRILNECMEFVMKKRMNKVPKIREDGKGRWKNPWTKCPKQRSCKVLPRKTLPYVGRRELKAETKDICKRMNSKHEKRVT